MSSVLRRIEAPTKYAGLSIKAWVGVAGSVAGVALLIFVAHTPLLPTLAVLSWFVASPAILLGLWAHQQGVSIPTLVADAMRWGARRRRRLLTHEPAELLRGGVLLAGDIPSLNDQAPAWTPDVDHEVL